MIAKMNEMNCIPLIIPAYEPDERFIDLAKTLNDSKVDKVIVVDDGSGKEYQTVFGRVEEILGNKCVMLSHDVNKGKGAALKTAFSYVIDYIPTAQGVVTADSDGQHDVDSIISIQNALCSEKDKLILGVRRFDGESIPWKSRFGNTLTRSIFKYVSGREVTDTQTGLRGIPRTFLDEILNIEGDRFEYEMRMLLDCIEKHEFAEVPIRTIYESKDNHQTHFNPVLDSIRIYRVLGAKFLRYIVSSLSSCVIDLTLFYLFTILFKNSELCIMYSTISARVLSATYNCIFNYKIVFDSRTRMRSAVIRYTLLAIVQMLTSGALVTVAVRILLFVPKVIVKAVVDTALFFVSYKIQQKYVFGESNK